MSTLAYVYVGDWPFAIPTSTPTPTPHTDTRKATP